MNFDGRILTISYFIREFYFIFFNKIQYYKSFFMHKVEDHILDAEPAMYFNLNQKFGYLGKVL